MRDLLTATFEETTTSSSIYHSSPSKMHFVPIVLAVLAAAFTAANPADDATSDALSPEYCPGGDGSTCCPSGYFSVSYQQQRQQQQP